MSKGQAEASMGEMKEEPVMGWEAGTGTQGQTGRWGWWGRGKRGEKGKSRAGEKRVKWLASRGNEISLCLRVPMYLSLL